MIWVAPSGIFSSVIIVISFTIFRIFASYRFDSYNLKATYAQGQVNSTGKEANVCSDRCRMAKYTLVCVRHGESEWNQKNLFCGWHDADLSTTGVEEAKNAGKVRSWRFPPIA